MDIRLKIDNLPLTDGEYALHKGFLNAALNATAFRPKDGKPEVTFDDMISSFDPADPYEVTIRAFALAECMIREYRQRVRDTNADVLSRYVLGDEETVMSWIANRAKTNPAGYAVVVKMREAETPLFLDEIRSLCGVTAATIQSLVTNRVVVKEGDDPQAEEEDGLGVAYRAGTVQYVEGPSGSGKTRAVLRFAAQIGAGVIPCGPAGTLMLTCGEDPSEDLFAIYRENGGPSGANGLVFIRPEAIDKLDPEGFTKLWGIWGREGQKVVVIDHLAAYVPDVSSVESLNTTRQALEEFARATDACVFAIVHTRKGEGTR